MEEEKVRQGGETSKRRLEETRFCTDRDWTLSRNTYLNGGVDLILERYRCRLWMGQQNGYLNTMKKNINEKIHFYEKQY